MVLNGESSEWNTIFNGVPQGSVLGQILFVIYINDLDSKTVNKLLKFADDSKLFGPVSSVTETDSIRLDLKTLCDWSEDWLMIFNVEKCKVVHFGFNNPKCIYI